MNEYKRCKICNQNKLKLLLLLLQSYKIKLHKEHTLLNLIPIMGKICSRCKFDQAKDSFHNDKYKKNKKTTICKDCRKVSNHS